MMQGLVWCLIGWWSLWLLLAWAAVGRAAKFRARMRRPARLAHDLYRPRAWVIVPFRGLDAELESNLRSLLTQNYPTYRLIWVVDSEHDQAVPLLRNMMQQYPQREVHLIIAGPAGPRIGQKVHNQLTALRAIEAQCQAEDAWVFADSDAVPGQNWLGQLVGPLVFKERTAVVTGYRWLVPTGDAARGPGMWSILASTINGSLATQYGNDALNLAWGGSMAILVQTAREGGLMQRWEGALTDDYPMTRLAWSLNKRVYFVPGCLVPTPVRFDRASFFNFAYRQYVITRVYAPRIYLAALMLLGLYATGWLSAVLWIVGCVYVQGWTGPWWWGLLVLLVSELSNHIRATLRRSAVAQSFDADTMRQLQPAFVLDRWGTCVYMLVHLAVVLRAGLGQRFVWRGIPYHLRGPQDVSRESEAVQTPTA